MPTACLARRTSLYLFFVAGFQDLPNSIVCHDQFSLCCVNKQFHLASLSSILLETLSLIWWWTQQSGTWYSLL